MDPTGPTGFVPIGGPAALAVQGLDDLGRPLALPRCPVCGRELPVQTGRGRPRIYDTVVCGEIASLLDRLGTVLDQHTDRMADAAPAGGLSPEEKIAATEIRARLFSLANLANRIGAPVASPRTIYKTRSGWRGLRPT